MQFQVELVEFYGDSTIKPKENGDLTTINGDFMVISGGIRVSCVFLNLVGG